MSSKKNKKNDSIKKLEIELKKIENKEFNIFFYVSDSKGKSSGHLSYIYDSALVLSKKGYDVTILHQEEEFIGVGEWMGKEYINIKHESVSDNISVAPSDFLIIPEIFTSVAKQTINLPCKKIVLCQNLNYVTEFIPLGESWLDYGINDIITTSTYKANILKEWFPQMRVSVVRPQIHEYFNNTKETRKLLVNIIAAEQSDINRIVKPFYWKYPMLNWVSFRELKGLSKSELSEALQESAITIWVDEYTSFGYSALEAIKSGNIVIGKLPEELPEWMIDNKGDLLDNGIWFNKIVELPKIINGVINGWLNDEIPNELIEAIDETKNYFNESQMIKDVEITYEENIITNRVNEMKSLLLHIQKQKNETNE